LVYYERQSLQKSDLNMEVEMVTIKVVSKSSGKPLKDMKVRIYKTGGFFGGGYIGGEVRTDSSGEAHFDIEPCKGEVSVNGSKVYEGDISGRVVVYV